jgi:hypothetical protein
LTSAFVINHAIHRTLNSVRTIRFWINIGDRVDMACHLTVGNFPKNYSTTFRLEPSDGVERILDEQIT